MSFTALFSEIKLGDDTMIGYERLTPSQGKMDHFVKGAQEYEVL